MFLLRWIAYGFASLLLSGMVGILVGKVIGFFQSTDDEHTFEEYWMARTKVMNRHRPRMRLKRVRIGRMRVGA